MPFFVIPVYVIQPLFNVFKEFSFVIVSFPGISVFTLTCNVHKSQVQFIFDRVEHYQKKKCYTIQHH